METCLGSKILWVFENRLPPKFAHGYACGQLEIPSLRELRERSRCAAPGRLRVREVVGGVRELHSDPRDAEGALFQVASQFNLLEMASPEFTPEHGVGGYEDDHTQGPACAIAARGRRRVYLTLLGGGVFGNELTWILAAMDRALNLYTNAAEMDVAIVSRTSSNPAVR